ncbi:MAG: iron-regulated protein A precursor [Gammaproteobacteria bacterium]|nr:iron-regulated protein A precursor [Gammaproteobacteria bacterium]
MKMLSVLCAALLAMLSAQEAPAQTVPFNAAGVSVKVANRIITQTYRNLNTQAGRLLAAVNALRVGGATEAELDAAQAQWRVTRVPWETSEGFLFGPVDAQGIDPLIDTWPLSTQDLQQFLAAGFTSTAAVLQAPENVQGFHTIEFLLFGDGVPTNDQPVAAISPQELAYVISTTAVFKQRTQLLETAWTTRFDPSNPASGPYARQLTVPGPTSVYGSQAAVIEELVNGLITILDEVGNGKIAAPLGANINSTDESLEESQFSYNSLTDFHNNVQSVLNVYSGQLGFKPRVNAISPTGNGLYTFVFAHNALLANQVLAAIVAAYDAIGLIDGDGNSNTTAIVRPNQITFRQAINDPGGRIRCQTAITALQTAQNLLATRVLPLIANTDFAL